MFINCLSKKSWPNLCSNLLYKKNQNLLEIRYIIIDYVMSDIKHVARTKPEQTERKGHILGQDKTWAGQNQLGLTNFVSP